MGGGKGGSAPELRVGQRSPVGIAAFLAPLAAAGAVLLIVGAAATHLRRHERQILAVNAVLLLLAAMVAVGRFGPYHF